MLDAKAVIISPPFFVMTIKGLYKRIEGLNTDQLAAASLQKTTGRILDANLDQLLNGLDKEGNSIRPTYQEDPFFDSPEEAQGYSDWKDRISPFSAIRKPGTPNLFINGHYHSTIRVEVKGDKIVYGSDFAEADDIEDKYNDKLYGLNPESRKRFIEEVLRPVWKRHMEIATGLKLQSA